MSTHKRSTNKRLRALALAIVTVLLLTGAGVASAATYEYNIYLSRTNPTVWTYRHQVLWTGNGSTISAYTVNDWSTYTAFGWSFTDTADEATFTYTDGGVQYKRKTTNGYYKFGVCPVCDEDFPWVEATVGAGGQHFTNGTGY